MSNDRASLTVRSFRLAFELERRIHKIDRFRLPLPYGLPLRSVAYALGGLAAVLAASALPLVDAVLAQVPWPIRFGVIPVAVAQVLTHVEVDGRPAHEVLAAWLRFTLGPRTTIAFGAQARAIDPVACDLVLAPDERGPAYRRGVVVGAGSVLLRQQASAIPKGRRLLVTAASGEATYRAKRVLLKPRQRVVVR